MPGEGSLYKVTIGNQTVAYFGSKQDPIVVHEPDGTRHELTLGQFEALAGVAASTLEAVAAIPSADEQDGETVWNDAGVLKVSSAAG